ncbi:MAG: serine/threonine protein kinase [Myxococcales bacterium]|nr:serine/threonine protein kinase [Myxococcales bacterium]
MAAAPLSWVEDDFGPYRLYERLGVGGMATVHRAVHRGTGERVALKRLLPQLAGDAMLIKQFRREAEIVQALAHPNMAYVHDFGEVNGEYYITMEEIDGSSLLDLLRRANENGEPAPIGVSLWVLREILCALDYAMNGIDETGEPFNIVHRDLSPSNVIVNRRGEVKIIDFGVAKSLHGRYATNSGRIKGKLGYMAPEALAGRMSDSRSDLYSLAVLGWELLTGRRLFRGNEREQLVLRAENFERTPPSAFNTAVPRELDQLLAVTLSEDPNQRWFSARNMLRALEPLLLAEGQNASPRALRDWAEKLTDLGQTSEHRDCYQDSQYSSDISSVSIPEVTMPPSSNKIPGVRRFHEDVRTSVDPILDAGERHRAHTMPVAPIALASGSSGFAVPTQITELDIELEPAETRNPDTLEINALATQYVLEPA